MTSNKHPPHISSDFALRPPALADLPALLALEQASFNTDRLSRKRFLHWFRSSNGTFLVCVSPSKQVAGYALILYRRNSQKARLYSIAIAEQYRGYGLAQRLLRAGEQIARKRHCSLLYLEVRPDNHSAIKLYQHLGYQAAGRRLHFTKTELMHFSFKKPNPKLDVIT